MNLTPAQDRWLTALESGDYQQATNSLRQVDAFCCLGVACDLSSTGAWHYNGEEGDYVYRPIEKTPDDPVGQLCFLTAGVANELNMVSTNGFLRWKSLTESELEAIPEVWLMPPPDGHRYFMNLSSANDSGVTFQDIAALIRRHPQLVFRQESE